MCEWIEMLTEQMAREKPDFSDRSDQEFLSEGARPEQI
jgi:hypothetical protein